MNKKQKLIIILEYLTEETDENHTVTIKDIQSHLYKYGIIVDRKTLYNDLEILANLGHDIIKTRQTQNHYYLGERKFQLAEVQQLVLAINSAKFITTGTTKNIIEKLLRLLSKHQAFVMKKALKIPIWSKTQNKNVLYVTDKIFNAITERKKIGIIYFRYKSNGNMLFDNDGKHIVVSPYTMHCVNDCFYLICYNENAEGRPISHFRIDRITNVEIYKEAVIPPKTDIQEYLRANYYMFKALDVVAELIIHESLVNVVLDRFGHDINMIYVDDSHFKINVHVYLNSGFLGWVFGFGKMIKIVSPEILKEEMRKLIQEINANL